MSETKPGMPSPALTEDDVRRIAKEVAIEVYFAVHFDRIDDVNERIRKKYGLPATPKDQEGQDDTQAGQVDSVTAD